MKRYRGVAAAVMMLAALPLLGCGNALEGGSDPSGSVIRVVSVTPQGDAATPDLYLTQCTPPDEEAGTPGTYESGLTNQWVTVLLRNDSRPNTPEGQSTNSYVTMNRYRVDFAGLNKTVTIRSIDGGGFSVGIQPDQQGNVLVLVLDFATMDYIRARYPEIGTGEHLTLRAHITIWGEDAFRVPVAAEADFTMILDDYDRCGGA